MSNVGNGPVLSVLTGNGSNRPPTWQLPAPPLGTITQYDVLVGGASNNIASIGPGTLGQVLQSSGNSANPAYSTTTYPLSTTVNQILYSSSNNVVAGLATANSGVLATSAAGVPSIDTTNFAVLTTGVQVKGNNTGTAPPAGFIGENIIGVNTGTGLSTGVITNLASIVLTPGIWNITAVGNVGCSGISSGNNFGISTTSTTFTGNAGDSLAVQIFTISSLFFPFCVADYRVTLSSSTPYYANMQSTFSTGTSTGYCRISATRVG